MRFASSVLISITQDARNYYRNRIFFIHEWKQIFGMKNVLQVTVANYLMVWAINWFRFGSQKTASDLWRFVLDEAVRCYCVKLMELKKNCNLQGLVE